MSDVRRSAGRERQIGWLCAVAVLVVWVAFQLAGRLSTRQSLTPWDVTALRHVGAFLAVLPGVVMRGVPRVPVRRGAAIVATSAFGFPIGAYLGLSLAPVALGAVILFGALPIVTALIGWAAFGDRPTPQRLASLPIIAAGIVMIGMATVGSARSVGGGALCFFIAVVCLSMFTLLIRRWRLPARDAVVTLSLFGAPVFLPVWFLVLPSELAGASLLTDVFQMIMQGVITAVVAMFLYTRAVNALGAGPPTLVAALVPGLASLGAWAMLGERLDLLGVGGVALATIGMVLGVLRGRPPPPARNA